MARPRWVSQGECEATNGRSVFGRFPQRLYQPARSENTCASPVTTVEILGFALEVCTKYFYTNKNCISNKFLFYFTYKLRNKHGFIENDLRSRMMRWHKSVLVFPRNILIRRCWWPARLRGLQTCRLEIGPSDTSLFIVEEEAEEINKYTILRYGRGMIVLCMLKDFWNNGKGYAKYHLFHGSFFL